MRPILSHKSILTWASLVVALFCWLAPAPVSYAQAPAAAVPEATAVADVDLAKLFDAVVDTIDRRFVDTELLKTLDWQARAREVRPSVISARTVDEAVGLIKKLLSELKTSHTELTTPDEFRYYITLDALREYPDAAALIAERFWGSGPYFAGIGAFTTKVDGRHFVDGVLEGSPADKVGLKFGDELLAVDGKPYSPIAAFRGKIGSTAEFEVRRTRDGEIKRYRIPVIPVTPFAAFSAATKASARIIEKGGRRIGYIHVWAIGEARTFRAALASIDPQFAANPSNARPADPGKPLDALIVDMRGRVGGDMIAAGRVLDVLGTAQKPYWGQRRSTVRKDAAPPTYAVSRELPTQPFRGQSAILIDHQTRSAGEILAHGYKRSLMGLVMGTQTAGAVSGGLAYAMPGGFLLLVAVDLLEFDGKPLEGIGVAPDLRIERPLPYAAGADPVLDAAIDHLARAELPHPMNGYGFTR